MEKVRITILNDNRPGRKLLSEHGLSYFIEFAGEKILLDAGSSDVFLQNANRLGIDLTEVHTIVLSHGHWDHGDGLHFIREKKLITHPDSFQKRYHLLRDKRYVGLEMTQAEAEKQFKLQLSRGSVELGSGITFLGEIPRNNDFEAKTTAFILQDGEPDFIMDDSGIVISTEKGLVVISGCAHAGICNTVQHAMEITGENRVLAVLGGFHLKKADDVTRKTMQWLQDKSVKYVIPSHCTELPALSLFHESFHFKQICTGDVLEF